MKISMPRDLQKLLNLKALISKKVRLMKQRKESIKANTPSTLHIIPYKFLQMMSTLLTSKMNKPSIVCQSLCTILTKSFSSQVFIRWKTQLNYKLMVVNFCVIFLNLMKSILIVFLLISLLQMITSYLTLPDKAIFVML